MNGLRELTFQYYRPLLSNESAPTVPSKWIAGEWSACSGKCGQGIQWLLLFCLLLSEASGELTNKNVWECLKTKTFWLRIHFVSAICRNLLFPLLIMLCQTYLEECNFEMLSSLIWNLGNKRYAIIMLHWQREERFAMLARGDHSDIMRDEHH